MGIKSNQQNSEKVFSKKLGFLMIQTCKEYGNQALLGPAVWWKLNESGRLNTRQELVCQLRSPLYIPVCQATCFPVELIIYNFTPPWEMFLHHIWKKGNNKCSFHIHLVFFTARPGQNSTTNGSGGYSIVGWFLNYDLLRGLIITKAHFSEKCSINY